MADRNAFQDEVLQRLTRIETMMATAPERCPYREDIAKASNNKRRLENLEATVTDVRLTVAKWGALAGAISGTVGALGTAAVLHAFGL